MSTVTFDKLTFDVQGTETVVLAAGNPDAPPLVFFHGGGTFHGWAFAEPWTSAFRVLIPYHPGFGESAPVGDGFDLEEVTDRWPGRSPPPRSALRLTSWAIPSVARWRSRIRQSA